MRPFLIPARQAKCFAPSTAMRAIRQHALLCSYRHCCLFDLVNFGAQNGRKSIWLQMCGAFPAAKMKARQEHVVPLCQQGHSVFNEAKVLSSGGRYVFPSIRSPLDPMSENTVNAALRRLGFTGDEMTAHGFRAMASTLLNESNKWSA